MVSSEICVGFIAVFFPRSLVVSHEFILPGIGCGHPVDFTALREFCTSTVGYPLFEEFSKGV